MNNCTNNQPSQIREYIFLSTIKMLLSSTFKFGPTAQIFPELALFHHTLIHAYEVVRIPLGSLRSLSQISPDELFSESIK